MDLKIKDYMEIVLEGTMRRSNSEFTYHHQNEGTVIKIASSLIKKVLHKGSKFTNQMMLPLQTDVSGVN